MKSKNLNRTLVLITIPKRIIPMVGSDRILCEFLSNRRILVGIRVSNRHSNSWYRTSVGFHRILLSESDGNSS